MSQTDNTVRQNFMDFAGRNGDYYANTFLKIQKSELPRTHINAMAMIGSFVWAALRGNWLLFVIGFVVDLITAVNLANVVKYQIATTTFADKTFLVERYEGWANQHLLAAAVMFVAGRLLVGWLADRAYAGQYEKWRTNPTVAYGVRPARLWIIALVSVLIVPLMM